MNQLTKYDAARYALSVAVEVDEVKDIRDKAEAMAAYARQAKDTELVQWATEIKVRAERRAGQMLAEMPKAKGGNPNLPTGHTIVPVGKEKTLADIGITKNESSRWQKLAAVTDEQFEHAVAAAKEVAGEVTTAAMLRASKAQETKPAKPAKTDPETPAPVTKEQATPKYSELDEAQDAVHELELQNQALQDRLDAAVLGATDEEKAQALERTKELRQRVHTLEINLEAVTRSRDQYQNEAAQAKKQCVSLQAKLKRLKDGH